MNSFQALEAIGICIIIGFQLRIFIKTKNRISVYRAVFPGAGSFEIIKPGFLKQYLELHPGELLRNFQKLCEESMPKVVEPGIVTDSGMLLQPEKFEEDKRIFIDLISIKEGGNEVTQKIVYALNTYLIRNRGVASDFHLIKDVVERNADAVEDDINQSLSLPLYLGLLGTFMGIVYGLFQISGVDFAADTSALNNAISHLLDGVKIAMIASFTGLLFTVINSGYSFKGAKVLIEEKKNEFYTFIQTDLLPLLNQNINSTLFSLQSNLHKFNEEFTTNVDKLGSVMGKNYNTIKAQEKIFSSLEKIDIAAFAKANIKVLQQLQLTTDKFDAFNQYLTTATELVNNAGIYTTKMDDMIRRTDNLQTLGRQIVSVFEENQVLAKFLQNHYSSLDESHQLITRAVNGVGNTLNESLNLLKEFTQERISEVQKITLKEIDLLENQYPEKWKKLDNLAMLETVGKHLLDIKMSTASQGERLRSEVQELKNILIELNNNLINRKSKSFLGLIRNYFVKKTRRE